MKTSVRTVKGIPPASRKKGPGVRRVGRRLTRVLAETGEALPELLGDLLGAVLQPVGEIVTRLAEDEEE